MMEINLKCVRDGIIKIDGCAQKAVIINYISETRGVIGQKRSVISKPPITMCYEL